MIVSTFHSKITNGLPTHPVDHHYFTARCVTPCSSSLQEHPLRCLPLPITIFTFVIPPLIICQHAMFSCPLCNICSKYARLVGFLSRSKSEQILLCESHRALGNMCHNNSDREFHPPVLGIASTLNWIGQSFQPSAGVFRGEWVW